MKGLKQNINVNVKKKEKTVSKELLKKYNRGPALDKEGIKTKLHQKILDRKERKIQFATEWAARAEVLLTEEAGYVKLYKYI